MAAGTDTEVDHADVHVLVDIFATLLGLLFRVAQDHQLRNENEAVDEELDHMLLENTFANRNLQCLVLALQT